MIDILQNSISWGEFFLLGLCWFMIFGVIHLIVVITKDAIENWIEGVIKRSKE